MIDSVELVCAVMAALSAGVLMAYGVCLAMFAIFRMHALQAAVNRPAAMAVGSPVPGVVAAAATVVGG